eukprot:1354603-Prymnesium_polylepis.1
MGRGGETRGWPRKEVDVTIACAILRPWRTHKRTFTGRTFTGRTVHRAHGSQAPHTRHTSRRPNSSGARSAAAAAEYLGLLRQLNMAMEPARMER